jgi:hypothetical protein
MASYSKYKKSTYEETWDTFVVYWIYNFEDTSSLISLGHPGKAVQAQRAGRMFTVGATMTWKRESQQHTPGTLMAFAAGFCSATAFYCTQHYIIMVRAPSIFVRSVFKSTENLRLAPGLPGLLLINANFCCSHQLMFDELTMWY